MTTLLGVEVQAQPAYLPTRDYISFSAIRTYQSCPLQYYFRYVAGLPKETISASLVFGSAIHRAIEQHFRRLLEGQQAPGTAALMAEYKLGWQEDYPPIRFTMEDDAGSFDRLAQRMLCAFAAGQRPGSAGRACPGHRGNAARPSDSWFA